MSGTNRLRVEPSERVDLEDFDFGVNRGLNDTMEAIGAQFLTDLTDERAWILSGFKATNPSGTQIQVTKGRAILSRREEGVVSHGMITFEGDATKIIDVAAFTTSVTYGVYIRFQYADGAFAGRAFWDSSGATEFTQTIATRRVAGWSMRIESSHPGAEWLRVGSFLLSGGPSVGAITDERPFYFEGVTDDSYVSGWSTDADPTGAIGEIPVVQLTTVTPSWPGGSGATAVVGMAGSTSEVLVGDFIHADTDGRWYKIISIVASVSVTVSDVHGHGGTYPSGSISSSLQLDRRADRSIYGTQDLQRFTAAVRQNLEDIKGRGLRRWWDRDIGGMNIGFDADPVEDRLAVGDAEFYLDHVSSTEVRIGCDTNDYIAYDRTLNHWDFYVGGSVSSTILAEGIDIPSGGLNVGFLATPAADVLSVGDALFGLNFAGASPSLVYDTDDYLQYSRAGNEFQFYTGGVARTYIDGSGVRIPKGLVVGHLGSPADDMISVGDANFRMYFDGTDPFLFFDSLGDSLQYDRSTNHLIGAFGGATSFVFSNAKKPVAQFYSPDVASDTLVNPATYTAFANGTYSIPLADLAVGKVFRFVAGGEIPGIGTASQMSILLQFALITVSAVVSGSPVSGGDWRIEAEIKVGALGGAGVARIQYSGIGHMNEAASAIHHSINSGSDNTLDLSAGALTTLEARAIGGDGSTSFRLHYYHIEEVQ
jgi:hypothetical protein